MGEIHKQIRQAIDVLEEYPENDIYFIPARLDDCQIPFDELRKYQWVDLFPQSEWFNGINKILKAVGSSKRFEKIDTIKRNILFKFINEKSIFVGRQDYIDNKLKIAFKNSKIVSIIGPGGSGKTQLAYKAMHTYTKKDEKLFDIIIPIYFSKGVPSFLDFLTNIAQNLKIKPEEFDSLTIEEKKNILYSTLSDINNPLLFLDNYETISDNKDMSKKDFAMDISFFLNNEVPQNTAILLTSRVRNNMDQETRIDLEGLEDDESQELFFVLVKDDKLKEKELLSKTIKEKIFKILKKLGGHPLSIEIIAKNMMLENIDDVSKSLGAKEINKGSKEERLTSLSNCFNYSIRNLDAETRDLLLNIVSLFKSPFSIKSIDEIIVQYNSSKNKIIDLFNASLLTRIDSDFLFGVIDDPSYYLYDFHLATRNYLDQIVKEDNIKDQTIKRYSTQFIYFHNDLAEIIYYSWGKGNTHYLLMAQFNIISNTENNDFDRAVEFGLASHDNNDTKGYSANISNHLGLIYSRLGHYLRSLNYHQQSLKIYEEIKNQYNIAVVNNNIGQILQAQGQLDEALVYAKKALEIDEELKNKVNSSVNDILYLIVK